VARQLQDAGYRVVAISDSKGGIYSDSGFDVESLYRNKQDTRELRDVYCTGSVCELVGHEQISNDELLALDVDLLIPAALEGVIDTHNVDRIRAPLIAEVANGPITSDAELRLNERGTLVLPDVLTNAGGVTVSYFEWVQNRQGYAWTLDEVRERLEEVMVRAFDEVWRIHTDEEVPLRAASYRLALRRIADAIASHGTREFFSEGGESPR
jgi:glutamate dehydrogenase (NADP+)